MLEDFVVIFESLLAEQSLASRYGEKAVDIARARLFAARRGLAYLERAEGEPNRSLRQILSLLRRWPLRTELYADLLKSCAGWALVRTRRL
jgi:hypothetical protein